VLNNVRAVKKMAYMLWVIASVLSGCSSVTIERETTYSKRARESLYNLDNWLFDGRLAITGQNDSWSANIGWKHTAEEEEMKLSGPLGQGATVIKLSDDFVSIDRGDGKVQTSEQPEEFVNQQLGVFVPIRSLRYWVVGLPEPSQSFVETSDGFTQADWLIAYQQMQAVNGQSMPRKITVLNSRVKLKLIIDQWILNHVNGK
jgi:outer membrane lipoprotein LolB